MKLSDLSLDRVRLLSEKIDQRDKLAAQHDAICKEIDSLLSDDVYPAKAFARVDHAPSKVASPLASVPRTVSRRPALKEEIVSALTAAGPGGLSVKELSAKIKANFASVNTWFYTTGKKFPGIKKIGAARYAVKD